MKLTKEDIFKFGTREEVEFLKEAEENYEPGESHEPAEDVFKDEEYDTSEGKHNRLDWVHEWRIQKASMHGKMKIIEILDQKTKKEYVVYIGNVKGGEKYIRDEILGEGRNPMLGYVNPNMFKGHRMGFK
jgi:hypothetical protein